MYLLLYTSQTPLDIERMERGRDCGRQAGRKRESGEEWRDWRERESESGGVERKRVRVEEWRERK